MKVSRGGMQTAGLHCFNYCPKCGRPTARLVLHQGEEWHMHCTKAGAVWHIKGVDGLCRVQRKWPWFLEGGN